MSLPPPHGHSLGLWIVKYKVENVVIFEKQNSGHTVTVPMTGEEFEYFVVGQSYSFTATQP